MKRVFESTLATLEELKAARLQLLQMPVKLPDGRVFQFSSDDREIMEGAIAGLNALGGVLQPGWRDLYNAEYFSNAQQLQQLYDELILERAKRGIRIDAEYMAMKTAGGYTRHDLAAWAKSFES